MKETKIDQVAIFEALVFKNRFHFFPASIPGFSIRKKVNVENKITTIENIGINRAYSLIER
ncbi:hypothetical protein D210916BOD24_28420 [Alteromonas sp. D210916BOD_24]